MSDPERESSRVAATRAMDLRGIDRLVNDLLPELIAKLASTRLGEIEVREGDWHVRLRRPAGTATAGPAGGTASTTPRRRASDRPGWPQTGHDGGPPGRAPEPHRAGRAAAAAIVPTATNGTGQPRREHTESDRRAHDPATGTVAPSPSVGVFQPGVRASAGTRVRAGDSLGIVNVLGVPQEVAAPADGIVSEVLVEAGTAVEYGQELVRIELAAPAEPRSTADAR